MWVVWGREIEKRQTINKVSKLYNRLEGDSDMGKIKQGWEMRAV